MSKTNVGERLTNLDKVGFEMQSCQLQIIS